MKKTIEVNMATFNKKDILEIERIAKIALAVALLTSSAFAVQPVSGPTTLVVAVSGCGVHGGTCTAVPDGTGVGTGNSSAGGYGDNQGGPLTLFYYNLSYGSPVTALYNKSLVFPQAQSGANYPVSAEYGSSSEGTLQLSGNSEYLTIGGYGINFQTFDAAYHSCAPSQTCPVAGDPYGAAPSGALAQSGSIPGQGYTPITRVAALIDANGNVNSSTALLGVFNNNNPRSVATADGINMYVSGQGNDDLTGGVFYTTLGSSTSTAITGADTATDPTKDPSGVATPFYQDTRTVQLINNTLYVSFDSKEGKNFNRSGIGTLGTNPTTLYNVSPPPPPPAVTSGPTPLSNFQKTGKVTITGGIGNNLNSSTTKVNGVALNLINLSPSNFFLAAPNVLYIADTGNPKNDSNGDNAIPSTTNIGDGGLQKWKNANADGSGNWNLLYTLYQGLGGPGAAVPGPGANGVVNNANTTGVSGLYGLTGYYDSVSGNVYLFATSATLSDLDPTYLYEITDTLANTAPPGTAKVFTVLEAAPADSNFKGVSFGPATPNGSVEVTSSPSGLQFTSAGSGCAPAVPPVTYTTPLTLNWTPSSSCTLTAVTPQTGGAGAQTGVQYAFSQWVNGANSSVTNPYPVTAPATPTIYNAAFDTQYLLTTSAGTGGSVSPGGFITSGTNATITATAAAGYYFVNFTGATTSTSNPLSLLMNGPQSITANFAPQITPTITWAAPSAINYGSALSAIQLDATANVPGTFVYTPVAGTVLPAGANQALSATFTPTDTTHYTTAIGGTSITVNPPVSGPANLVVTKVLSRTGGNVIAVLTMSNTGGSTADNVVLSSVKIGAATATPLPQSLGSIAAGSSTQATVSVPGTVGASGAGSSMTVSGSYTGATFSSSARIVLP